MGAPAAPWRRQPATPAPALEDLLRGTAPRGARQFGRFTPRLLLPALHLPAAPPLAIRWRLHPLAFASAGLGILWGMPPRCRESIGPWFSGSVVQWISRGTVETRNQPPAKTTRGRWPGSTTAARAAAVEWQAVDPWSPGKRQPCSGHHHRAFLALASLSALAKPPSTRTGPRQAPRSLLPESQKAPSHHF